MKSTGFTEKNHVTASDVCISEAEESRKEDGLSRVIKKKKRNGGPLLCLKVSPVSLIPR